MGRARTVAVYANHSAVALTRAGHLEGARRRTQAWFGSSTLQCGSGPWLPDRDMQCSEIVSSRNLRNGGQRVAGDMLGVCRVARRERSPSAGACGEGVADELGSVEVKVQEGTPVPTKLFYRILCRCISHSDLAIVRKVDSLIRKGGLADNAFLASHLIRMYACLGSLQDAHDVFNRLPAQDELSWAAIISAYCRQGQAKQAIALYHQMRQTAVKADRSIFVAVLKACASCASLVQGKLIHGHIMESRYLTDASVSSALVEMYAKCGSLVDARSVFDGLTTADVVTWTGMISAYSQFGDVQDAFELFWQMVNAGLHPDMVALLTVLKACSSNAALDQGRVIHAYIAGRDSATDRFLGSALMDMYVKCGSQEDAREVFDSLPYVDLVSWNNIITAYSQSECAQDMLQPFLQMQEESVQPDSVTFLIILKGCSSLAALELGRLIQVYIQERGLESDLSVANTLISMFAKCNSFEDASRVFDRMVVKDSVTWTGMIMGYAQAGDRQVALELIQQMQREDVRLEKVSLLSILKVCSNTLSLAEGKLIHDCTTKSGLELDISISNSLIHMYSKCGSPMDARGLFERLPARSVVTYNAMIAAYCLDGDGEEAFQLFRRMQTEGVQASKVTVLTMLKACSKVGALHHGKALHTYIVEGGLESDADVLCALINMYAKCGSLEDARAVFDRSDTRDLIMWTAMISGCAEHGAVQVALQLFQQMQQEGVQPNNVTFLCLLNACSHAGLWEKGSQVFLSMSQDFGLTPKLEHYACMVDLLGRLGYLDEAEVFIHSLPEQPDLVLWMSLLGACRTHVNVDIGWRSFEEILKVDMQNAAAYRLMADIYAMAGMQRRSINLSRKMMSAGAKKEQGRTWMESGNEVHTFVVEDTGHRERREIYLELEKLVGSVRQQTHC